jgi:hypothetical protein
VAAPRELPFTHKNRMLFAVGLAAIVLGYLALSVPPADGFLSLTLAPLLLVIGYCVLIPLALLAKEDRDQAAR